MSKQSGLKYALKDRVSIELIGGTSDGRDTFSSVPLGCGERTGEESWSIGGGGAESQSFPTFLNLPQKRFLSRKRERETKRFLLSLFLI